DAQAIVQRYFCIDYFKGRNRLSGDWALLFNRMGIKFEEMTINYGKIQQIFWCLMVILLTGCGNTPETENQQSTNQSSGTNMPIGVALYSFNRFPFAESLDKSKEAGVAWVEGFFFHNLGPDFDE